MTRFETNWNLLGDGYFQFSSNEKELIWNFLQTEISSVKQNFMDIERLDLLERRLFEFAFSFYSFLGNLVISATPPSSSSSNSNSIILTQKFIKRENTERDAATDGGWKKTKRRENRR